MYEKTKYDLISSAWTIAHSAALPVFASWKILSAFFILHLTAVSQRAVIKAANLIRSSDTRQCKIPERKIGRCCLQQQ